MMSGALYFFFKKFSHNFVYFPSLAKLFKPSNLIDLFLVIKGLLKGIKFFIFKLKMQYYINIDNVKKFNF